MADHHAAAGAPAAPVWSVRLALLVFVGGALGTLARYGLDHTVGTAGAFPLSTALVNLVGSFVLGFLTGLAPRASVRLLVGTGLMGGFTTYSALAVQLDTLVREGDLALAALHGLGGLVLGVIAAAAGWALGQRRVAS